jgi:hypothetical protein
MWLIVERLTLSINLVFGTQRGGGCAENFLLSANCDHPESLKKGEINTGIFI